MTDNESTLWVCPECRLEAHAREPGLRCQDHPDRVLVHPASLERFPDDKLLGQVVAGKYAVHGVLGMGGFGAVYRAVQEPVGRTIALKVVHPRSADDPELRARFFREARVVARLKDPGVVTLYDYGEEPNVGLYMVFELVEGITLNRLLREGPQAPVRVAHIALQLLRTLAEAHALGMVHRDLKPANVMLVQSPSGEEVSRLLDFGIAKVVSSDEQENSLQTQRGLVMGTPRYLSPEQARATGDIDLRCDIYSLGVMMYALLAGKNPFERASVIETIMAHCNAPPPPFDPELEVPAALEAVVLHALEKEPEDRYQSASEMASALQSALPHVAFPSGHWHLRASETGAHAFEEGVPTPSSAMRAGMTPPSGIRAGMTPSPGMTPSGAGSLPGLSAGIGTGDGRARAGQSAERPLAEPIGAHLTPASGTWSGGLDSDEDAPRSDRRRGFVWLSLLLLGVTGAVGALWWSGTIGGPSAAPVRTVPSAKAAPTPPPLVPSVANDPAEEAELAEAPVVAEAAEEAPVDAAAAAPSEPAEASKDEPTPPASETKPVPRRRPTRRARRPARAPDPPAAATPPSVQPDDRPERLSVPEF